MNIDALIQKDKSVAETLRRFYTDPNFRDIRIAFTSHSPVVDDDTKSAEILLGRYVGVRSVFNKIEEIFSVKQQTEKEAAKYSGSGDPDLSNHPVKTQRKNKK